eukprot:5610783-Amphidinium_carterae.1
MSSTSSRTFDLTSSSPKQALKVALRSRLRKDCLPTDQHKARAFSRQVRLLLICRAPPPPKLNNEYKKVQTNSKLELDLSIAKGS